MQKLINKDWERDKKYENIRGREYFEIFLKLIESKTTFNKPESFNFITSQVSIRWFDYFKKMKKNLKHKFLLLCSWIFLCFSNIYNFRSILLIFF